MCTRYARVPITFAPFRRAREGRDPTGWHSKKNTPRRLVFRRGASVNALVEASVNEPPLALLHGHGQQTEMLRRRSSCAART
jgi:hypothetical protein